MTARIMTTISRFTVYLLVLVGAVACARGDSARQRAEKSAQSPLAAESEDSLDRSTGVEVTCQFVKTVAHPDPRELADEFLRRDATGQFLGSNPWFEGATDCPGHEAGPDTYTMVAGYVTTPLTTTDSVVRFVVTYRALGEVHADATDSSVFDENARTVVDTLTVRHTTYGWRVRSPALWLRVLADSAFAEAKYRPFHTSDAERIRTLLAAGKRGA